MNPPIFVLCLGRARSDHRRPEPVPLGSFCRPVRRQPVGVKLRHVRGATGRGGLPGERGHCRGSESVPGPARHGVNGAEGLPRRPQVRQVSQGLPPSRYFASCLLRAVQALLAPSVWRPCNPPSVRLMELPSLQWKGGASQVRVRVIAEPFFALHCRCSITCAPTLLHTQRLWYNVA